MADVTISSLPAGTPSGNNILPYSTGSNTLGTPVSALYQGSSSFYLTNSINPTIWASTDISLTSQSIYIQANTTSLENRLGSYTNHSLTLVTNNTERMRINTNGDVSIPGKLTNAGVAKAWASFNGKAADGTNQPIRASYNISSILRTADNNYIVTFPAGVFSDTNYAFIGSSSTSLNRASIVSGPIIDAPTTTTFRFANFSLVYTGQPAGWINESAENIYIAFFAL